MNERKLIYIEPGESSFSAYEVSKKVISLLRHNQTVQREDDGTIQFWRIKFHLCNKDESQTKCDGTHTGVDAGWSDLHCFLEPTSRPDDVREHACQSSQNHPGLELKSLHAPSAGNCSLRAN